MEEIKQPITEKQVVKDRVAYQNDMNEMRRIEREESRALYSEERTVSYDPKTGKLMVNKTRRK